jgi:pyruvate dehydrogenase E2 component (dihydrolipoamide acetyltransferase)
MLASVATSPHAMTAVEVDYENVERVRTAHKESWLAEEGFPLTYLPFISRAVLDALRDFPHLNASVGNAELVVHNYVNLAIAVDVNFEGLLAPVVHGADDMRLRAIARSIHDLASRARSRELSADDISGGTFTISNSGSFGTHMVIPIINQPQVAILSTDGISRKPVVVTAADGTEAIAIHSVGMLAMAWDHRAFDGAYAAAFLSEVRNIIEQRDWEAEL